MTVGVVAGSADDSDFIGSDWRWHHTVVVDLGYVGGYLLWRQRNVAQEFARRGDRRSMSRAMSARRSTPVTWVAMHLPI